MAFILSGTSVVSYAEAADVRDKDQRLFEAKEISFADAPDAPPTLDDYIEDLTAKATGRINQKIRASDAWRKYCYDVGIDYSISDNVPAFNPDLILSRKSDFTDMCCYFTLYSYLLPKIADFGNPESPEVQKIQFYEVRFNDLFTELTSMWDWYDADASGAVDTSEKVIRFQQTRRSRGRRNIVRVN